ncbi:MAG: glycosyltransferase [Acidobacteriota bacterium]|nr:glycosyltransferase [Acidobacteriota bacterium]
MRIAQIVLSGASAFERKLQRIDAAALAGQHEVVAVSLEEIKRVRADVAHVYATGELPTAPFVGFPLPYLSSAAMPQSRWSFRRPVPPKQVVTPLTEPALPEAVDDSFFETRFTPLARDVKTVGSFARDVTRNMVDQTLSRIHRFRSDVTWALISHEPTPRDLAAVDVWADPAVSESDYGGFTAEALVFGLPVVASRTAINAQRLEQGRTGFLVPPGDPNEMTHAILAALFKTEVAESKQFAARQTASKFRARQRLRVLTALYERLIR